MKITFDKKADVAYIKLNNKSSHQNSKKIAEGVLVDYAKDGTVVGIAVLDASRNMPLPLNQIQVPIESVQSHEKVDKQHHL
ncbi:MAG TPA: DUF2283 domain-containing protein [Candidatus Saccharimonadia bacterium]|nr:DUF2283 domain-containing protein [Candidatus Saccharimonadia bacterium]